MSKYQIRISALPRDRVMFIKALRLVAPMNLKQAHNLANHLEQFRNSTLVAGIDKPVAEHLESSLRDTGAAVILEESSVSTPMLCTPEVNTKHRWGMFRVIKKAI